MIVKRDGFQLLCPSAVSISSNITLKRVEKSGFASFLNKMSKKLKGNQDSFVYYTILDKDKNDIGGLSITEVTKHNLLEINFFQSKKPEVYEPIIEYLIKFAREMGYREIYSDSTLIEDELRDAYKRAGFNKVKYRKSEGDLDNADGLRYKLFAEIKKFRFFKSRNIF